MLVQVDTLLTVIGEEAREVFATFTWETEGDDAKLNERRYYSRILKNAVNPATMYLSKGIVSTAAHKNLGSPTGVTKYLDPRNVRTPWPNISKYLDPL